MSARQGNDWKFWLVSWILLAFGVTTVFWLLLMAGLYLLVS